LFGNIKQKQKFIKAMNKIKKSIGSLFMIAVVGFMFSSCTSNPDSSGLEYMPDMYRSPAIEPYVDYGEIRGKVNQEYVGRISAMVPPSNTIPYLGAGSDNEDYIMMMMPYNRKPSIAFKTTHGLTGYEFSTNEDPDYEYKLAANDKNPLKITKDNAEAIFKKGKELFVNNCVHCHGEKGDGNGPMVTSGAYSGVPDYGTLTNLGDGQLFYSIYYGKGAMGSHASLVNKKEIWTLVHYIRKFQDADYGSFKSNDASVESITEESKN
jgi:mono/diheme cytochrome c family protein